MDYFSWSADESPAGVLNIAPGIGALELKYGPNKALSAVLGYAQTRLEAKTAIVEYRYLDADYRSEHRQFYTTTFRRYPGVAERIHFFREPLSFDDVAHPASVSGLTYLGYSVMRPVPGAPVGRTVLATSSDLTDYVSCVANDSTHLFGSEFTVRGAPFMAQDARLGVCAHATIWVTAYYHHLAFRTPRFVVGSIADVVPPETGLGRPLPATGLTRDQLTEAFRRIGLPPLLYPLDNRLPAGESLFRIACRYLNSGLPVTVLGGGHAFVLIGYRRIRCNGPDERIVFVRQDDEVGPYDRVLDPFNDAGSNYRPWQYLVVPLPAQIYVTGEEAEALGAAVLTRLLDASSLGSARTLPGSQREPHLRTILVRADRYKSSLSERGAPDDLARIYALMQLPEWVWVVELVDRGARDAGEPCVAAEILIDPTNHVRDPRVLAWRIPGELGWWSPDRNQVSRQGGHDQIALWQSLSLVASRCN